MPRICGAMLVLIVVLSTQLQMRAEDNAAAKENKPMANVKLTEPGTPLQSLEGTLAKKITCEFVHTPAMEVFAFLQSLKSMNLIISPGARAMDVKISLKVVDMSINDVLKYVCKLANFTLEVQDQAIFIASADEGPQNNAAKKDPVIAAGVKVRIKLGNGNEFESDASIFNSKPELLEKLVDRFLQEEKSEKK